MQPSVADTPTLEDIEAAHWYHTLDLPGAPTTKGFFDLRELAARVLPDDLSGKRCLDACTASGFWAFELERRGAAEVVAIDITSFKDQDWQIEPAAPEQEEVQRSSFEIAHRALASKVERHDLSVYDVTEEALGTFDFIFIGAVLIHLRDPVRALRALRSVMRPGAELRSLDVVLLWSSILRPRTPRGRLYVGNDARWWTPNAKGHTRWLQAAGLSVVSTKRAFERFGPYHEQSLIKGLNLRARILNELYVRIGVPCQLAICRAAD